MKNRVFAIVAVIFVLILGYYAWVRWKQARAESSGDVQLVQDSSSGDSNTKVVMDKDEVERLRDAADKPASTTVTQPATASPASIPATDSVPPNPPNGARFTGTGRYQLYRQGDLTWRLDTDSGRTCIIFATDDEWRKPRVYSHGCGNQ
jgi:cytoskeletal protein RodZ